MRACGFSFSALQRAENSSIPFPGIPNPIRLCFSALQRAENSSIDDGTPNVERIYRCFSALQRAENSSMLKQYPALREMGGFSALQRAENSSIPTGAGNRTAAYLFQCSSASRKFLNAAPAPDTRPVAIVSVLFSEPKIPQCCNVLTETPSSFGFSALQRAENSSMYHNPVYRLQFRCFSALQRAENSSIIRLFDAPFALFDVSVLFSEPKIPQFSGCACRAPNRRRFSALQRAENSSISTAYLMDAPPIMFQCSSASRKFLNPVRTFTIASSTGTFQCSSASRKFLNRYSQQ